MRLSAQVMIAFIILLGLSQLHAQHFPSHYERHSFLMGSAGSYHNGLLGFSNPANTQMLRRFNFRYQWATERGGRSGIGDWGVYTAGRGWGFAVQRQEIGGFKAKDYQLAFSGGHSGAAIGFSYTWHSGDKAELNRENLFTTGLLLRPSRYLSVGATGTLSTEKDHREGVVEVGIRPFGDRRLTLFGDAAWETKRQISDALWSAGAALQIFSGVDITGRYFESEAFTVGLNFSFGGSYTSGQSHYDNRQKHYYDSYSVGFGDVSPSIFFKPLFGPGNYVKMELKGRVDYQRFQLFDSSIRFLDLLEKIRNTREDPRVDAIALNLSGMRILPENAWELRNELQKLRATGKKVVIFIDNANMTSYHLASIADRVMLDPQGSITLPGYVMGRTYLKGTLDKLGIGFEPWQYFKYKSAVEGFYREDLSEGDREQRQAYLDDIYELIRKDVTASRKLTSDTFDKLVDDGVYFLPSDAIEANLADTLGRWDEIGGVINDVRGVRTPYLPMQLVQERAEVRQHWGSRNYIAVVYALGVCAMDEGINARHLGKVLNALAENRRVKGIVLRVDSPGGDGMASDVVAEAIRKCTANKPVVISQGQVAASGGYWISMYGDKILAAPNTITGSIGVIAGWIYNKGFTEKLGMTSDFVKRGKNADMMFGVRLPLLGLQIPAKNLNEEQQARAKDFILRFYDEFVEKVADGRDMSTESVYELAQGRVYSGTDGKANGLVDGIGGLADAIDMVQEMAGLADDAEVEIVEFPRSRGLFNSDAFSPIGISKRIDEDETIRFIRMMTENPGHPLPMLLPGEYPVLETEAQ